MADVVTGQNSELTQRALLALTSDAQLEAVELEAQALAREVGAFEQRYQRFNAVTEVLEVARPVIHTRAPAVPAGLFPVGDTLVAGFDLPGEESPEVTDLLRAYVREGQQLRPAPNPFAHHKPLARALAELYLSHRGRVRFRDVIEDQGLVYLRFMVRHGAELHPRSHVIGLDLRASLEAPPLLRTPLLPEALHAGVQGVAELDRAQWVSGKPTSALYYHTRVGPLYAFVERGTLKLRDKVDVPRGAADLVIEGAADADQAVKPHRTEVLVPSEALASGDVLVRIEASPGRPWIYVYYRAHPRIFAVVDLARLPGVELPDGLGALSSMFLWAGNTLNFLGGQPAPPLSVREAAGPDRLFAFQRPSGQLILHHLDLDKRKILHSFFDVVAHTVLPDGHLYLMEAPPDQDPAPALEHTLRCFVTPFKVAVGWTPEEQRHLRSFEPAQVVDMCGLLHKIRPTLERKDFFSGRHLLDKVLVDYPFVERIPELRDGMQRLRAAVTRCIDVEQELAEIHQRRRQSLRELEIDLGEALPRARWRGQQGFTEALEALQEVRRWLGRLEQLAAERFLPEDVLRGQAQVRLQLEGSLRHISADAAAQVQALVTAVRERARGLELGLDQLTQLSAVQSAEQALRADAIAVGRAVEGLQSLDLSSDLGVSLARDATASVVECERLEVALAARRRGLAEAHLHDSYQAYVTQLDLRIATDPRALSQVEACDGRLEALIAEIEGRKADFADLHEGVEGLSQRIVTARERYEARKLELTRSRDVSRRQLESRFQLRLQALMVAARGTSLEATALEGFLAAHADMAHCQQAILALESLGFVGEAAALKGRLEQTRRLLVAERREAALFQAEGEALTLAGVRFHRNRQTFALREVLTSDGPGLALTGTGLVLGPDRLGSVRVPQGYSGLISETDTVARAELLAFYALSELEAELSHPDGAQPDPAAPGVPELDALEARCRALALAHPEHNHTLGLHDRDAARLVAAMLQPWLTLGRLRFPSSARVPALRALLEPRGLSVLKQARATLALSNLSASPASKPPGGRSSRSTSRASSGPSSKRGPSSFHRDTEHAHPGRHPRVGQSFDSPAAAPAWPQASGATQRLLARHFSTLEPLSLRYLEAELLHWEKEEWVPQVHPRALAQAQKLRARVGEAALQSLIAGMGGVDEALGALIPAVEDALGDHPALPLASEVALCMLQPWKLSPGPETTVRVEGLASGHERLPGDLELDLPDWHAHLSRFVQEEMPALRAFRASLAQVREKLERDLELSELNARPLARFVWTRLMRRAYVPLLASALEKQLGSLDRPGMDQMGLLLLISPPGYGKTELLKKLASLLGYAFVSVSGTSLGKRTTSLDPAAAPDGAAASALMRLHLGLELRENVLLDIEDVQACSDELLSRLLPLCDATRQVEILKDGRPSRIDLQGRRVAIVMTLNPLHATIPQALSNRATMLNLGDVADKHAEDFALSFLEVAAPMNVHLEAASAQQDLEAFAQALAERQDFQTLEATLNGGYARTELRRIQAVLEHCVAVRDVLMAVNKACLQSASVQDAFRVDPPFELQGSYRDMVEICRSAEPDWNQETRRNAILRHYEGQAGLLGPAGEYNLLALRSMLGLLDELGRERMEHIRETYRLIQSRDRAAYVLMERITELSQAVTKLPLAVLSHGEGLSGRLEHSIGQASRTLAHSQQARIELAVQQLAAALDATSGVLNAGMREAVELAGAQQLELEASREYAQRDQVQDLKEALTGLNTGLESLADTLGVQVVRAAQDHGRLVLEAARQSGEQAREAQREGALHLAQQLQGSFETLATRLEVGLGGMARWVAAVADAIRSSSQGLREALDAEEEHTERSATWERSLEAHFVALENGLAMLRQEVARVASASERPRARMDLRGLLQGLMEVMPGADGGEPGGGGR